MDSHTVLEKGKRARNWCFTINNYTQNDEELIKSWDTTYLVFGRETAPTTKTCHLQCYCVFPNARTLFGVKKLHNTAHWEIAKGNAKQNYDYCSKCGDFEETGKMPAAPNNKGGKNGTISRLRDDMIAGKKVGEIVMDEPDMYHMYGRTLNAIEDEIMILKRRTEMTKGLWIWGPTGVGKSHFAFNYDTPENTYVHTIDGDWWDSYRQQKVVVINEFRGEIKFSRLLELCDKWPTSVRRRGRAPLPFISEIIIITSCSPPEEIFKNIDDEDRLDQLYRRFEVRRLMKKPDKVVESLAADSVGTTVNTSGGETVAHMVTEVHTVGRGNTTEVCATSPDPIKILHQMLK